MSKNTEKTVEYLNTLAQENKLDDATKANLLKVFENAALAEALGGDVLRHADFSRNSDELRKEKDEFAGEKKEWKGWYGGAVQDFEASKAAKADLQTKLDASDAQLKTYRDSYGDPPGAGAQGNNGNNGAGNNPPFDTSKFMTREDHEKALRQVEANSIGVIKSVGKLTAEHILRFKAAPDFDALEKIAVETGLPINDAYQKLIAPQVAEQAKTAQDEALKKAKEEGRQEAMRDHKIPTDDTPSAPHIIFDAVKPEDAPEGAGREAFLGGMREPVGAKQ